jgi:ribosomal protein S18 acetylase RimI-like enzyme
VNLAYQELATIGLNFTGSYQDETETLRRMQKAEVYSMICDGRMIACMNLTVRKSYVGDGLCLYIHQLAVLPEFKRQGIGSRLLDLAEKRAIHEGLNKLQLDTATTATHLVKLYRRRGFTPILEVQWEGKTYRSYIMEKILNPLP